jgi:hypothetical protein
MKKPGALFQIDFEETWGAFQIDFEKDFYKIKWSFLLQLMEMKGFPRILIDWVMKAVTSGKVGI